MKVTLPASDVISHARSSAASPVSRTETRTPPAAGTNRTSRPPGASLNARLRAPPALACSVCTDASPVTVKVAGVMAWGVSRWNQTNPAICLFPVKPSGILNRTEPGLSPSADEQSPFSQPPQPPHSPSSQM